ncbi:short-chain dehydrogenase/reductase SDR [Diaporthe helianthi]|uniref:Short-chain dehydrogenase/reductase SDR n=1 Tax=Diaporthe helianthi TaxID=158607 RepID=A0A2P5I8P1_DIAHE|nr:short-chain dehydrogenase/reductase SDR [Diaporthe helianthi]
MSTSLSTLRILRLAFGNNTKALLTRVVPATQQSFTTSYPVLMATPVDDDKKLSTTVYTRKGKLQSAINVSPKERTSPEVPETNKMEDLTTLSDETFKKLPTTVQSMTVKDKVIIITGGARGLGNCMAKACAEAGARAIVLFDSNQELGDASATSLHEKTSLPVAFYKEKFGTPDVLINAAGIADSNIPAETYDATMFRRLVDINLTGSFLMSQAVGRAAIAAGKRASIVLVASMSGSIVNYPQEQSCYNASKAGVVHLGRSLAAEWAKYNIHVNCISPGYMDTALNKVPALEAQKEIWKSLTPQQRLGNVDELNGLCVFLASDASSFMTGANCVIDGGYSLY